MNKTCLCGGALTRLGLYALPNALEGEPLKLELWACGGCGRVSFYQPGPVQTTADYEALLQDLTAEELTLRTLTGDTPQEREAAENVLWNKFHELASY